MFTKFGNAMVNIADRIDVFLFGSTSFINIEVTEPTKLKIIKPGDSVGPVINDFSPPTV